MDIKSYCLICERRDNIGHRGQEFSTNDSYERLCQSTVHQLISLNFRVIAVNNDSNNMLIWDHLPLASQGVVRIQEIAPY